MGKLGDARAVVPLVRVLRFTLQAPLSRSESFATGGGSSRLRSSTPRSMAALPSPPRSTNRRSPRRAALIGLLDDGGAQFAAVEALAEIGDPSAAPALRARLNELDRWSGLRTAIEEALGKLEQ